MTRRLLKALANPPAEFRGKPFWAWNGKLVPEELRRQIRVMKAMGLGGFFMHSRVGLETPYLSEEWFECVKACVDEAKKQKMEAWLYDEDRWPSGAAGGLVTREPQYRSRLLVMQQLQSIRQIQNLQHVLGLWLAEFEGNRCVSVQPVQMDAIQEPAGHQRLLCFHVEIQATSDWYNGQTYLDTLNPEAVKRFIEVTHEAYRRHCGDDFGKAIPGIFTDEPNWRQARASEFHYPWTDLFPKKFRERYGYDLLALLPHLAFDIDERSRQIRWHFYDCATWLFTTSFAKQIGDWCQANNLLFTGHVLMEETLQSQTNVVGAAMRFYEHMQAPGMDLLTEYKREYHTAKQVSSVARQFNRRWRLTETYGCTGWHFPLAGHKALGDWQLALGINLRCHHLTWYTMEGQAKRDFPAGIFHHSPWWRIYSVIEDYFARCHVLFSRGREVRDIAVIHPIESMWILQNHDIDPGLREKLENDFARTRDALLAANLDFDYLDEDILARHGKNEKDRLRVGAAAYQAVVVPPLHTLRHSTIRMLKTFAEAGGILIFLEPLPSLVDAVPDRDGMIAQLAAGAISLPEISPQSLGQALAEIRRISILDASGEEIPDTLYQLREEDGNLYLFIANTSDPIFRPDQAHIRHPRATERRRTFPDATVIVKYDGSEAPVELDPVTGKIHQTQAIRKGDFWYIQTSFPSLGSRIFLFGKEFQQHALPVRDQRRRVNREFAIADPATPICYSLDEPNVLVLDQPQYKIGNKPWRPSLEILKIDAEVRKAIGVSPRGGRMVQPWAREKTANPPQTAVTLKYDFTINATPAQGELFLALERPESFEITLNGYRVHPELACGWWVDPSLQRVPLDPAWLKHGNNTLILKCPQYAPFHPGLESVFLLGYFAVRLSDGAGILDTLPNHLHLGSIGTQGLPFYSGNLIYHFPLHHQPIPGERWFLQVPEFDGTAVRIIVDDKDAAILAWPPYEAELTAFLAKGQPHHNISIQLFGHRRNSHGPLHFANPYPHGTGPFHFISEGKDWSDDYVLLPVGLNRSPVIKIITP